MKYGPNWIGKSWECVHNHDCAVGAPRSFFTVSPKIVFSMSEWSFFVVDQTKASPYQAGIFCEKYGAIITDLSDILFCLAPTIASPSGTNKKSLL